MSARKLTHTAGSVLRQGARTAWWAVGLATGTARAATGLARDVLTGERSPSQAAREAPREAAEQAAREGKQRVEQSAPPAAAPTPVQEPAAGPVAHDPRDDIPGPDVVAPAIPRAEDLPEPIVIEADDTPETPDTAFQTEPKAASRESARGQVTADPEEVTGHADEVVVTSEPDIDVETPVGTTGADVATNPDTAESDLQQPGTPPLDDPALAKAVRSEAETLQRGAERNPD